MSVASAYAFIRLEDQPQMDQMEEDKLLDQRVPKKTGSGLFY